MNKIKHVIQNLCVYNTNFELQIGQLHHKLHLKWCIQIKFKMLNGHTLQNINFINVFKMQLKSMFLTSTGQKMMLYTSLCFEK